MEPFIVEGQYKIFLVTCSINEIFVFEGTTCDDLENQIVFLIGELYKCLDCINEERPELVIR